MSENTGLKNSNERKKVFCKHCGAHIYADSVCCIRCGRQVNALDNSEDIEKKLPDENKSSEKDGGRSWITRFISRFMKIS